MQIGTEERKGKKMIFIILAYILTGLLYLILWYSSLPWFTPLIAVVPFLWAEDQLSEYKRPKTYNFLLTTLCFIIISVCSYGWIIRIFDWWEETYEIVNASTYSAALLVATYFVVNSMIYAAVAVIYSIVKEKIGRNVWGYSSFIIIFTAFEHLYNNLEFAFPAIRGGIAMVNGDNWHLQWYEYTGIEGGTIWMLSANVFIYLALKKYIETRDIKRCARKIAVALSIAIAPAVISLIMYNKYEERGQDTEVVMVQPNYMFNNKFEGNREEQLHKMLKAGRNASTPNTKFIILPETAIAGNIWANNLGENPMIQEIHDTIMSMGGEVSILTGADMMEYTISREAPSNVAMQANDSIYVEFFNAAILVDAENAQYYKKSKRVPWVENNPLAALKNKEKGNINNLLIGTQKEPTIMFNKNGNIASIICFESMYGEYVSEFVKKGAEAIFVITNDGWWNGTNEPEQHKRLNQIRAIENRRDVARCGNTGITTFINQRGDEVSRAEWWTDTTLRGNVKMNNKLTFYSKHGDWIGIIALILCLAYPAVAVKKRFAKPAVKGKKKKK